MWEQIRANRRKSIALVFVMAALLVVLGYFVGEALAPRAGLIGAGAAGFVWLVLALVTYFQGDAILLRVSGAREISHDDHPQLFNVVEEMTIAAGLPKPPKVYIVDDMALNAFATGRSPDKSAVAVTAGLLGRLNRDQLQGVVAHEMSHIVNRDVLFMTVVGIMMGTIVMVSETFLRMLWFTGGRGGRYRSKSSRGGGKAQALTMIAAILLAILAPILAQLIYLAVSRRREYLADASAAMLTRYPEGLASALELIGSDTKTLMHANRATAPMYIANPIRKTEGLALNLAKTHPPIAERVRILRSIAGGISYVQYQRAWQQVSGKKSARLPQSAIEEGRRFAIRDAHPDAAKKDPRRQMREVGDLLRKVNEFAFLACVCGMKIKLPPEFKGDEIKCPRCHRSLAVPVAQMAAVGAVADAVAGHAEAQPSGSKGADALQVVRHNKGWTSFKCACGATQTLAPSCLAAQVTCSKCGRRIKVQHQG